MANFDRERVAAAAFFESFGLTRHDEAIDTLATMLRQTRDSERDRIAADLIKQGEGASMGFAEAMEYAALRIREGKP